MFARNIYQRPSSSCSRRASCKRHLQPMPARDLPQEEDEPQGIPIAPDQPSRRPRATQLHPGRNLTQFTTLPDGNIDVSRTASHNDPGCHYIVESIANLQPREQDDYAQQRRLGEHGPVDRYGHPRPDPVFTAFPRNVGNETLLDAGWVQRERIGDVRDALDRRDEAVVRGESYVSPPGLRSVLSELPSGPADAESSSPSRRCGEGDRQGELDGAHGSPSSRRLHSIDTRTASATTYQGSRPRSLTSGSHPARDDQGLTDQASGHSRHQTAPSGSSGGQRETSSQNPRRRAPAAEREEQQENA